ncbi:hypothetical protein [Escherichia coli]
MCNAVRKAGITSRRRLLLF